MDWSIEDKSDVKVKFCIILSGTVFFIVESHRCQVQGIPLNAVCSTVVKEKMGQEREFSSSSSGGGGSSSKVLPLEPPI